MIATVKLETAAVADVASGSPEPLTTMTRIAIRLIVQIEVSSWRYTVKTTIRKKRYEFRARLQGALECSPCSFAHAASMSWSFSSAREAISVEGNFGTSSIERKDTSDNVAPSHCSFVEMLRVMIAVLVVIVFTIEHSDMFPAVKRVECSYISVTATYRCRNLESQALLWLMRITLTGQYLRAITLPMLVLTTYPCRSLGVLMRWGAIKASALADHTSLRRIEAHCCTILSRSLDIISDDIACEEPPACHSALFSKREKGLVA